MNKIKIILLLLLVFVLTITLAVYYENHYRVLVRFFFNLFQGDKIKFIGKNFHLFASLYFVVAFGLFSVLLTMLLYGQSNRRRFVYLFSTIVLFFIATIATTFIDSFGKVVECTACKDGVRSLHYNAINYDFHFITSLLVGLLPLLWSFLKRQISKRRQRKPAYNIGIATSVAGRWNFGCLHRCTFVRADEFQFGFLSLTSTLYFQLGSSSGLDEQWIPHLQQYLSVIG